MLAAYGNCDRSKKKEPPKALQLWPGEVETPGSYEAHICFRISLISCSLGNFLTPEPTETASAETAMLFPRETVLCQNICKTMETHHDEGSQPSLIHHHRNGSCVKPKNLNI